MPQSDKLILFQSKQIRRIWHDDEWWFSVLDIVEALTESPTPRQYWGKVKQREFVKFQLSPIWVQLKLESADGKKYATDCVNTKNAFRLIQSIPSKKVAKRGGGVAGKARSETEKELGRSVITKDNCLSKQEEKKKLK